MIRTKQAGARSLQLPTDFSRTSGDRLLAMSAKLSVLQQGTLTSLTDILVPCTLADGTRRAEVVLAQQVLGHLSKS